MSLPLHESGEEHHSDASRGTEGVAAGQATRVRVMTALPDDEGKSRDAVIDRYATPGTRTTSGDERIATLMRSRNLA